MKTPPRSALRELEVERSTAVALAMDALGRYKFWMFGYYASRAVFLGQLMKKLGGQAGPNPFAGLVRYARQSGEEVRP